MSEYGNCTHTGLAGAPWRGMPSRQALEGEKHCAGIVLAERGLLGMWWISTVTRGRNNERFRRLVYTPENTSSFQKQSAVAHG